jgi:hypothetical protein
MQDEYKAGLDLAIERGWLVLHESARSSGSRKAAPNRSPEVAELSKSLTATVLFADRGHRFPISEVIEPGPFMNRSATRTTMKVAGVSHMLLFLARRVDRRAARAGEMDDQPGIVHSQMMDLDSAFFQRGEPNLHNSSIEKT